MKRWTPFACFMVVVSTVAIGPALAEDLDYEVYGKVHVSLNAVSNSDQSWASISSNASRLGFRGRYAVSERLDAIWQFEGQLNTATNDFTFGFNRNSFLGMEGSWGQAILGKHDSPLKTLGRRITWFEDTIGDFRSTTMSVDERWEEAIFYSTPAWDNGFGGQIAYWLDQSDGTDPEAAAAYSIGGFLSYAPSSFLIGLGIESKAAGNFNPEKDDTEAETTFRGVGRYATDRFGVAAFYQGIDNFGGSDGLRAQTLGLEAMFMAAEKWRTKGSFYATDPNVNLDDNGYSQFALGLDYVLERAVIYLQYAIMMNDDDQQIGLGNNDWGDQVLPSDYGESPSGLSLGCWVEF